MNHKRIQNELSAYLDNELTPSRHKQVEAHLRSCSECSDMLSAFQQNRQRVADLSHPVPSTLKDAVMAEIHTQFQDELSAYLDNELAPATRQRIEAHLHTCSECSDTLSAFRENRERIKGLEHLAPASIQDTVMATIRQQAAAVHAQEPVRTRWLPDFGQWLSDFGRWFSRPLTAGATGFFMFALILGFLYLYPSTPEYDETLDFYFGLHTEQLADNPLKSNVGGPLSQTSAEDSSFTETVDDTELFLNLHLENVGD
jgi:anti-sigma factor RsiW